MSRDLPKTLVSILEYFHFAASKLTVSSPRPNALLAFLGINLSNKTRKSLEK